MRYLTIFQRFLLVIGLLSIALAGVLVVQVGILRTTVVEERQSQVRQMVDLGKSILASYDAKVRSGSLSPDAARRDAFDAIGALRWGPYSDYFAVYGAGPDDAGVIYVDANPKYIGVNRWNYTDSDGKHLIQDIVGAARSGGGYVDYRVPRAAGGPELRKIAFVGAFGPPETALALEAGVYVDDIDEAVYQKAVWAGLCGLVGLVFAGIAALGIARSVTTPLSQIGAIMDRLAAGDFGVTISAPGKRSQISRICRSLTVFKDVLVAADQARQQQMQADRRAAEAKQAALHDMATTVEADTSAALKNIRDRAATMTEVADQMRASAVRTDQAVSLAAAAAEQSLASARSVAGAAEELAASINGVGGKMLESSAAVGRAVAAGTETRATIEALNENVSRIGDVVGIIDSIAAKTNLLALNATIEAARAGDAGKGFAVVAHEVKQLASQTAKSTAEIAAQIDQVRNSTSASVAAVQGIEQTIREINAIAGAVAAAIEQQGAATAGIARSVDESAKAAEVMTIRIGDVSIEAGKASRFSDAVQENVTGLDFAMEEMRHSVTRVARTSTGAPDRRNAVRYKVDLPAQVFYQGVSREVRLHDLSDTGARIRMKMEPQWPTHARGILCFEGFGLPFVAQSHEGGTLRVAFDLDAKTAASFHGSAERFGIGRGRVAA